MLCLMDTPAMKEAVKQGEGQLETFFYIFVI